MNAILILLALTFAVLFFTAARPVDQPDPPAAPPCSDCVPRSLLVRSEARSRKRLALAKKAQWRFVTLRRTMLHGPTLAEAIALASVVYRVPASTLWRRVLCESHANRWAHNASGATSYWQFLPSTWRSTPFGGFSIYSTYAQAFAAGWMMGPAGRGGEWSCR